MVLIKHNGPIKEIDEFNNISNLTNFKIKIKFKLNPSMEAQVASIADDIAYNNHDLEDGFRAGLFSINEFTSTAYISNLVNKHAKNAKNFRKEIIINQIIRELINIMVNDVILTTNKNLKKYKPKSINDIYLQNDLMVSFSKK